LPAKADRYFLSQRIFTHESRIIQAEALQRRNTFQLFRSTGDDDQLLKLLQERTRQDGKWLIIHLGIIFLICNFMACLLYVLI